MEMRLREKDGGGFETVILRGDCDMYSAPKMRNALLARIRGGARKLRLDLSEVAYLDSTGVGSIIQILQAMKAVSGEVVFRGVSGAPRRVLEMSQVLRIMREEGGTA